MSPTADIITDIRGFNRFYTNILGLLDQHILDSGYSLTEARVLFEISKIKRCKANNLVNQLRIDRSYMSRMIMKFEKNGLITKEVSDSDNRVNFINLTEKGWSEFHELNNKSNEQVEKMIEPLSGDALNQVHNAMNIIKKNLAVTTNGISIRTFADSDVAYVITRHITMYKTERNLSSAIFNKYIEDGVHNLVQKFDEEKDCMYILEYNGSPAGCVAITHTDEKTAQFRYFFLEPEMRGLGAGHKLIDMAIDFCRQKGYKQVFLWTISAQKVVRHLYGIKGFKMTDTHENREWGEVVLEERWDFEL